MDHPIDYSSEGFTSWAGAELPEVRRKAPDVFDYLTYETFYYFAERLDNNDPPSKNVKEEQARLRTYLKERVREFQRQDPEGYGSILGWLGCLVVGSILKAIIVWAVLKWVLPDPYEKAYFCGLKLYRASGGQDGRL